MKYISINRMQDFEFHDSEFSLICFTEDLLKVRAKYLNIHSDAQQNACGLDMEIDEAIIEFRGFQVISYDNGKEFKINEIGEPCAVRPQVVFSGEEAKSRLYTQLKCGFVVLDLGIEDSGNYYMDANSFAPAAVEDLFFVTRFTFDSVTVSWDSYRKPAWYTEKRE